MSKYLLADYKKTRKNLQILHDEIEGAMEREGKKFYIGSFVSVCGTACCAAGAMTFIFKEEFRERGGLDYPFEFYSFSKEILPSVSNENLDYLIHHFYGDIACNPWGYLFSAYNENCVKSFKCRAQDVLDALDVLIKREEEAA